MENLITFAGAALGYGKRRILEGLDFQIQRGDYLAIVGSNGSGKTTLLRSILGLLPPLSGRVQRSPALHFGYVPQLQTVDEYFPLTVGEVVLMGRYGRLGALKRPTKDDRQKVRAALEDVGALALEERLYSELSGGQKQRTLIARALVGEPDVLILDEHTNDLDITGERAIMALLDELHAKRNFAVVMVSHSLNTVANHARSIGLIRAGRFSFARTEEILQGEFLSEFYGLPLQVLDVHGRKVVA